MRSHLVNANWVLLIKGDNDYRSFSQWSGDRMLLGLRHDDASGATIER